MKDIDETLLLHKQITVTTYGTRTSESFSGQVWSKRLFLSVMATGLIFNLSDGGKIEGKPLQNVGSSGNCMYTPQFI